MRAGQIVALIGLIAFTTGEPATPPPVPTKPPKVETVTYSGEALLLTKALADRKVPADPGPIEKQVVLETAEGTLIPLLCNDASRALFLDHELRDRAIVIQARRPKGVPYAQVVLLQVLEEGKLRIPEYYCDICTISSRYPLVCPCCQGPMVLRMKPEAN